MAERARLGFLEALDKLDKQNGKYREALQLCVEMFRELESLQKDRMSQVAFISRSCRAEIERLLEETA